MNGKVYKKVRPGKSFEIMLEGKAELIITGPEILQVGVTGTQKIPFKVELQLEPLEKQKSIPVILTLQREIVQYKHVFNERFKNQ
jgi:hypothetical protein